MWIDDDIIKRCAEKLSLDVWIPKQPLIVLGSSNRRDIEVKSDAVVAVEKRYGGGGTVVLYEGCVVVSLGTWVRHQFENKKYFQMVNDSLIEGLRPLVNHKDLLQAGLSDIVADDKKLVGTSLFRSRNYLLYQASILVNLDLDLINSCLAFPSRQPDYRDDRSHDSFLTSVAELGGPKKPQDICNQLRLSLPQILAKRLGNELTDPVESQFKNLLARAERN